MKLGTYEPLRQVRLNSFDVVPVDEAQDTGIQISNRDSANFKGHRVGDSSSGYQAEGADREGAEILDLHRHGIEAEAALR